MHERLVAVSGRGLSVRRLGGDRAGEIRITRFLRNDAVSLEVMLATAAARTCSRVAGRHVLAIQDTTTVRAEEDGQCIALHPLIAVDAIEGALLGLVSAQFFGRTGAKRAGHKNVAFADKESRRWLDGANAASALKAAGAACVTVIADREGDIYEDFACRPAGTEVVIRAGQDRKLADGSRLFARLAGVAEAGRMSVDLAAARRIIGFYRRRWIIEELFRSLKTRGFDVERLRLAEGPFEKLVLASLIAAVTVLQLVHERDGRGKRPLSDAFDPQDDTALQAVNASLEGKTQAQKNPHPKASLAYAAWVVARLGGWTGYYGKPGPIVMLHGLVQFHAIKHGWNLRHV